LRKIFSIRGLKVLDVVEVVPEKDKKHNFKTVKIATEIVKEFMKN